MGSSPLTRGKHVEVGHGPEGRGLIPAHAGKTTPGTRPRGGKRAHPRSRGENACVLAPGGRPGGSSPLTRGKPPAQCPQRDQERLIPAHAGKTGRTRQWPFPSTAHPRSRGENAAYVGDVPNDAGSSPLTRGKLLRRDYRRVLHGLIPAHAGKTTPRRAWLACLWAHPRSRGENDPRRVRREYTRGSSPLTRGKPVCLANLRRCSGLIPAHAGKTRRRLSQIPA